MKLKKPIRIALTVLLALVLAVCVYVAYVMLAYHRIPDLQTLEVTGDATDTLTVGEEHSLVSWNMGFGAYESDFGFFMDGGDRSWAWSKKRLNANLDNISALLKGENADLLLVQEVDTDSTRTYHVNELDKLTKALAEQSYCRVFAMNYDSPFLFYPITQPHGASKAGVATFSSYPITSAVRRSLPIEEGFTKFLDLDRCYSVSRIPVEGGGELVLYNLHLSAYTSDGTIAVEQLELLLGDMEREYEQGHYCIAGGDFNKDLLGDSSAYFGKTDASYTWAQPIPEDTFDGYHISLVPPLDEANPVPSCRNADGPYHEGQYVVTVDGFLVTDNVAVSRCGVIDTGFRYSDHNPVRMEFALD